MATSRSRERYAPGGGCQGGVPFQGSLDFAVGGARQAWGDAASRSIARRKRPARLVYRARSGADARSDEGPARGPRLSRPEREERLRSGGRRRHTDDGHRERGAAQHYLPREARERPRGARLRERQDAQELHQNPAGGSRRGGSLSLRNDEGQDYITL